ncbi:PREDICTED: MLP-like protein 43 [Brassica oleracea var. oleracea]|uniref:Bet v I/Major latex protein domain-containing protein n=1 Tax=Brassica oleracea var. oleracea TaxID=109376 RepID=A0A0D3CZP7_BRAOL|nr:PREDICTED: MLP-like protein 43 [Brassica oleracea var. oleracea]
MAEAATEIAKKMEEKEETPVTVAPTKTVEATSAEEGETKVTVAPPEKVDATNKPAEEEVKTTETSSLLGKLEAYVEIKASAEQFHNMFTARPHHVTKASPGYIQGCELHEGDWGKPGSIIFWNYFHDGEAKVARERIEAVDPEKNLITLRVIEGDLMKEYKSFLATLQVTPKHGGTGSIVHWHLEYEKIGEDVAHPETLLQLCVEMSKEIDEHLLSEE